MTYIVAPKYDSTLIYNLFLHPEKNRKFKRRERVIPMLVLPLELHSVVMKFLRISQKFLPQFRV